MKPVHGTLYSYFPFYGIRKIAFIEKQWTSHQHQLHPFNFLNKWSSTSQTLLLFFLLLLPFSWVISYHSFSFSLCRSKWLFSLIQFRTMVFHQMIVIRFVFSILLGWLSSSSVGATNSTKCDQYCGASGSNGPRVSYPFGFSEGCGIRLDCTESTGEIRIGEYQIQNVTSETLMVNFPVNCSRQIEDLQQFDRTNFGMTWRNGLLLQNCKVRRSECTIPSELLSGRLNIQSCDSKKENVSCYSAVTADYLDYQKLRNTGCGIVVSSILIGMDNDTKKSSAMFLEFQTMELAWGLEGDCACDDDANCTNVSLPGNRKGFRCRCKDGFVGDGFRDGDGCRKG